MYKLWKNSFFLFVTVIFCGCVEDKANVSVCPSKYDPLVTEHILNYSVQGRTYSICIEEEFDLAEGEIKSFDFHKRPGGISFTLNTEKEWYYILNINADGKLILYRMNLLP